MKTFKFLASGLLLVFLTATSVQAKAFKIALILDKGGKDDKSFNASAYQGAMRAKKELKADLKFVEATDDNAFEPLIRSFAKKGFDIIFSIGVSQTDAVKKVAQQYPDKKFVLVDGELDGTNIRSIVFEEHEGAYLVGAIAALTSKTGTVGFIGGMDIPLIRRFAMGYESGARAFNGKTKVISNYIGVTADSWNNPAKAKELAFSQYESGADVIFSASGASGTGIFDAAEEKKKLAIGVDSNQNWVKPGYILTSMVKRLDEAVYQTAKDAMEGKFVPGIHRYGLANQGVDYSVDNFNEKVLTPEVRKKVEELKLKIINNKIKVPDFYKTRK